MAKNLHGFSPSEVKVFQGHFAAFDTDGDGFVTAAELSKVMAEIAKNDKTFKYDEKDIKGYIAEVDKNKNGTIEFDEFLDVMVAIKGGKSGGGFGAVYSKKVIEIKTETGGAHTLAVEEVAAFASHLNNLFSDEKEMKQFIPIAEEGMDLVRKVADGWLLAKFINLIVKDTIDERAMNKSKNNKPLLEVQKQENLNLCIKAALSIGVKVTNVGATDLMNGEKNPWIVLGILWQLVKLHLLNSINLKNHPELIALLEDGETLADLLKLPPEQLLLRWFNYHLKAAGHKKINNFGPDVRDSDAYITLLNQLDKNKCGLEGLKNSDIAARATTTIGNAEKLGVKPMIKNTDIVAGNPKLNLAFTAAIFNQCPGLTKLSEEEIKKFGLMDDDFGDSREERAFRMWINSLNIDDGAGGQVYVNSLFDDCKNGLVLLRTIEKVTYDEQKRKGIVDWKQVNLKPRNKFESLPNTNYAVKLATDKSGLKFSLVGIAGSDIYDGQKKALLALVWQLMRYHTLKYLAAASQLIFNKPDATDEMIIEWANKNVADSGKSLSIKSYQDPALKDGLFFVYLLASIRKDIIDWEIVKGQDSNSVSKEDSMLNAKYAISIARKLGGTIFILPEDIYELKPKMILTFLASCMSIYADVLKTKKK
jgi:plastin-1